MKTKLWLLALPVVAFTLTSLHVPDVNKEFAEYVKLNDSLFAAKYEVTNMEYREFLSSLKTIGNNDLYAVCLYDSAQWDKKFAYAYNEPMRANYHSHPAYDRYPVVNISQKAAEAYCKWLTERYNSRPKREFKAVTFRLPSEVEWKRLAAPLPGHNLPWYGDLPYTDPEGKAFLTNIKITSSITGSTDYTSDGGFHTTICGHYKPNTLGIYDAIGNVAEMTREGMLKGGSWDNFLLECTTDQSQSFTLPDPRVGFRVVMLVHEK
ncbi:MAG TPA: SUMF1/EgtB/PvdO family nonheme iron enzyme [Bacteroidales bacterium]|nr:SUMF1/EgtB/PvdO family nonheme iron enzyme [Bacteroidales bacterium]